MAKGKKDAPRIEVEESPQVQEALARLEEAVPENPNARQFPERSGPGRAPGATQALINERNDWIIGLYMMGLSTKSIKKSLDNIRHKRGWPAVTSSMQILRIISKHYQDNRPAVEDLTEYKEGLKEAAFDQQELLIEKAVMYMQRRDDKSWKPFEFMSALKQLYDMRQQLIENQNWNASRANPMFAIHNESTQVMVFGRNEEILLKKEDKALGEVIDLIEQCSTKN